MANWRALESMSSASVSDYFDHIKDTVNAIDRPVICCDLTDGLSKFFDAGTEVQSIGSTKKFAREGDFLISRLRSYLMEMGIVARRESEQLFSTEFLVFRAKTETLSAQTLFALCMTDTVQTILKRGQYGTEHPRFYDFLMENLPIPDCLRAMDGNIRQLIHRAGEVRGHSRELYATAETRLLSELSLTDWQPRPQATFVQSFATAWQTGRMDPDYFQPQYGEIVAAVKGYPGGWDTLGNLVNLNTQNYLPESGREYQYIELANIGRSGEVTGCMQEQGQDLPSRARRRVTTGDVIVSSIEGSLESVALIDSEYDQALCSTGFHVVNSSKLNSETLLALLKSPVGQLQLKRGCSGTILSGINRDEFSKIILPIITSETQAEIREQVAESAYLRRQSRRLLDGTKTAVELAIEQGAAAARAWLEQEGALG